MLEKIKKDRPIIKARLLNNKLSDLSLEKERIKKSTNHNKKLCLDLAIILIAVFYMWKTDSKTKSKENKIFTDVKIVRKISFNKNWNSILNFCLEITIIKLLSLKITA